MTKTTIIKDMHRHVLDLCDKHGDHYLRVVPAHVACQFAQAQVVAFVKRHQAYETDRPGTPRSDAKVVEQHGPNIAQGFSGPVKRPAALQCTQGRRRRSMPLRSIMRLAISSIEHSVVSIAGMP